MDTERRRVEHTQMALLAMLGTDQVADIAMQRPTQFTDVEETELASVALENMELAVSDLYEFLPAIRNLRRAEILDRERISAQKHKVHQEERTPVPRDDQTDWTTTNLVDSTIIQDADRLVKTPNLVDSTIQDADRLVKTLESQSEEGKLIDNAMARLIKKERERLDEWASQVKERPLQGAEQVSRAETILMGLEHNFGEEN